MEEILWLNPFITDGDGSVAWQTGDGSKLPDSISEKQIERGAIKLAGQQSCVFDCSRLELPKGFFGRTFASDHAALESHAHES